MSSLFDALSEEVFQVLKGSGKTLTLYGPDGNKTYEPSKARRVFAQPDNIMLSVIESGSDSDVRLYLSQSTDVDAISKLIDTLRMITTRYNVLFNVRKFGRELSPKDFAYQTVNVQEAAMYGTTRTSYQRIGDAKMIVKHTAPIREDVFGSRSRNILSIFVETIEGERFKFPANYLAGGRAFARHIDLGGKPHDVVGTQISELALECVELAKVGRFAIHNRKHLGETAQMIRTPIRSRIVEIRKAFSSLTGPKGYQKVIEAGLPLQTTNLNEDDSMGQEIGRLMELLGIDSNHALAESLTPVALLTMGENMTTINEMFHGVIALDEAIANELIEALISEYGYDDTTWTHLGSNLAFSDAAVFEDAQGFLDLNEAAYSLHEDDQFMTYATHYSNGRLAQSGYDGRLDNKEQSKHQAGISELADALRNIFSGKFNTPDFPERDIPHFTTPNAKMRYYLDLYVSQNTLGSEAASNYVSAIIDKLAEGQKLDGAENTVAKKLYQALDDELNVDESIIDEQDNDWDRTQGQRTDTNFLLQHVVDDLTPEAVLDFGGNEHVGLGDSPADFDNMSRATLVDDTRALMYKNLEGMGSNDLPHSDKFLQTDAEQFVDKYVIPFVKEKGFEVDESIDEFAMFDDKPEHHGIAAGDKVATDMGYAQVISIEGDMAVVEYLNGKTDTMHVDDMDKVEGLGESREERELAEWFNSLMPESVLQLDELSVDRKSRYFNDAAKDRAKQEKKADAGDENAAKKLKRRDTGLKMAFDKMREDSGDQGEDLINDTKVNQDQDEDNLNEKAGNLFSDMPTDILQKKLASVAKDPKFADYRMQVRKELMRRKNGAVEEGYVSKNPTFETTLDLPMEDDVPVTVDYYMDDGHPVIEGIVGQNGEEYELTDLDQKSQDRLYNEACENEADKAAAEADYAYDRYRDDKMDREMYGEGEVDEGKLGNPHRNEDDDACAHCGEPDCHGECYAPEEEMDEAATAELNTLLKNAMFRR